MAEFTGDLKSMIEKQTTLAIYREYFDKQQELGRTAMAYGAFIDMMEANGHKVIVFEGLTYFEKVAK